MALFSGFLEGSESGRLDYWVGHFDHLFVDVGDLGAWSVLGYSEFCGFCFVFSRGCGWFWFLGGPYIMFYTFLGLGGVVGFSVG